MMVGSLSRKNNKISHKVKKDLRTNTTSSSQQFTIKSLKSLFITTVRFGFFLLVCQKIFNLFLTRLNQIKRFLSFSMVSEEYRRAEATSSVNLNETSSKLAARTTPTRIMLDDETVQKYRKKLETLSIDERKDEFVKEKDQGNECFKRSRYELAIQHYTRCILSDPQSDVAYSNRALAFLKMNKYTQALEDCNEALRIEPRNVKAKYRRGLALHHKNMFPTALQDFEDVVRNEPNNFIANHYVSKLRELLNSQPRKIMLLSSESSGQGGGSGKAKVIHIPEKDYHLNPKYRHCIQVNEWGLVKPFCKCNNGEPEFIRQSKRQMETQRRKQRALNNSDSAVRTINSDSSVMNNVNNSNSQEPTTSTSTSQSELNKVNSKGADESVNILAKGFIKSLSKETITTLGPAETVIETESGSILESGELNVQPETASGTILESKIMSGEPIQPREPITQLETESVSTLSSVSGEPIFQTKSNSSLIRNMPLLGDEIETEQTQVEVEQIRNNQVESVGSNNSSSVINERIVQGSNCQKDIETPSKSDTSILSQKDRGTLSQQDTETSSEPDTGSLSQKDTGRHCQQETGTSSESDTGTPSKSNTGKKEQSNNHSDCNKVDNQPKPNNKIKSNIRPSEQETVNCNGIELNITGNDLYKKITGNDLELRSIVQQKTEKEIENKLILESGKKNKLKTNKDQTCEGNLKQNKMKNIFTIVKPANKLDNKEANVPDETQCEPVSTPNITTNSISLINETIEKPVEVLANTDKQNEPSLERVLTKAQKRHLRRRTNKHSQERTEEDEEQKDNEILAETNHVDDNLSGSKMSTKSKKDSKINDMNKPEVTISDKKQATTRDTREPKATTRDTIKPQATTGDTATTTGDKKRLKRKISTNNNNNNTNNKPKPNETNMGQSMGDSGNTKQTEQKIKKYEDTKTSSKLIRSDQKTTKSTEHWKFSNPTTGGNCEENSAHANIAIEEPIGKRLSSNKKINEESSKNSSETIHKQGNVNKLLKTNHISKSNSNKGHNKSHDKDNDTVMLSTGNGTNIMNGHHVSGEGDYY